MSGAATIWHVYILRCVDASLYTGVTTRLAERVAAHNAGRGAKYTRSRLPVELVYEERVGGRGDALSREAQIKRLPAEEKRRLVAGSRGESACADRQGCASDAKHPQRR